MIVSTINYPSNRVSGQRKHWLTCKASRNNFFAVNVKDTTNPADLPISWSHPSIALGLQMQRYWNTGDDTRCKEMNVKVSKMSRLKKAKTRCLKRLSMFYYAFTILWVKDGNGQKLFLVWWCLMHVLSRNVAATVINWKLRVYWYRTNWNSRIIT